MDFQINTVGELADFLATQPRDRVIVMAKDAEGNDYSPLAAADEGMYLAHSTWSGEKYMTPEQIAEYRERGIAGYAPAPADAVRVVVLGPVN